MTSSQQPSFQISPGLKRPLAWWWAECVIHALCWTVPSFSLPFHNGAGKQDAKETEEPLCFVKQVGPQKLGAQLASTILSVADSPGRLGPRLGNTVWTHPLVGHPQQSSDWALQHTQIRGQPGSLLISPPLCPSGLPFAWRLLTTPFSGHPLPISPLRPEPS